MSYQIQSVSVDGSVDKGIRRYTRLYKIFTDSTTYGPGQIAALMADTLYGSWSHGTETDLWALCKKKSARCMGETEGGYLWTATAEYDSEPFEFGQNGTSPSGGPTDNSQVTPTSRPWQITFGSNKVTKLLGPNDLVDVAVVASNGQPFDPPPEIPYARPTITIVAFKSIASDGIANCANFTNSINNATWQGIAAKHAMCTEYSLQSVYEQGAWYWQKTVTVEIYDKPLNPVKVLDAGTWEKPDSNVPPNNKPRPILDHTGNPVSSPVPLDGNGAKLDPPYDFENFVYQEFTGYRELDWSTLI